MSIRLLIIDSAVPGVTDACLILDISTQRGEHVVLFYSVSNDTFFWWDIKSSIYDIDICDNLFAFCNNECIYELNQGGKYYLEAQDNTLICNSRCPIVCQENEKFSNSNILVGQLALQCIVEMTF